MQREKNKSWIKLYNRLPEQIDYGVSLGVVHLPSSLPNPLHEHLVKARVKMAFRLVIGKTEVILLDSDCTFTQTMSIALNLKSCNIS